MKRVFSFGGYVGLVLAVVVASSLRAADKPAKDAKAMPAAKDPLEIQPVLPKRLPDHYAAVIDDAQRDEIYAIQARYAPEIEKLQAQLSAVMGRRNAEIRAVLTPEQQIKVDALTDEAAKKQQDAQPSANKADANARVIDAMNLKSLDAPKAKQAK